MTIEQVTAAVSDMEDLLEKYNPTRSVMRFDGLDLVELARFVKQERLLMLPPDIDSPYWFVVWERPNLSIHLTTE